MRLTVHERVVLLGIIPNQGDITTLRVMRDLAGDLSFSAAELKALNMKSGEGQVTWDGDKAKDKDVTIPAPAMGIIRDTLKAKSEAKELDMSQLPIYDRFVDGLNENGTRPERRRANKVAKKRAKPQARRNPA